MVISQISLVHSSKTMIKGKRSQLPIETGIANNKRSLHDNNHFRLEYWMPALLNNEAQKEAPQYRLTVQLLYSPGCHTVGCRRRANKHPIAALESRAARSLCRGLYLMCIQIKLIPVDAIHKCVVFQSQVEQLLDVCLLFFCTQLCDNLDCTVTIL